MRRRRSRRRRRRRRKRRRRRRRKRIRMLFSLLCSHGRKTTEAAVTAHTNQNEGRPSFPFPSPLSQLSSRVHLTPFLRMDQHLFFFFEESPGSSKRLEKHFVSA